MPAVAWSAGHAPGLAIFWLNLARLAADGWAAHGHRLLLAQTFIDPARFTVTCYRAANGIELGAIRGLAKSNTGYVAHDQAKRIWVFPLHRDARGLLASPLAHRSLPRLEVKTMEWSRVNADGLFARLNQIADPPGRRARAI